MVEGILLNGRPPMSIPLAATSVQMRKLIFFCLNASRLSYRQTTNISFFNTIVASTCGKLLILFVLEDSDLNEDKRKKTDDDLTKIVKKNH